MRHILKHRVLDPGAMISFKTRLANMANYTGQRKQEVSSKSSTDDSPSISDRIASLHKIHYHIRNYKINSEVKVALTKYYLFALYLHLDRGIEYG
jgi:hypothetical protein